MRALAKAAAEWGDCWKHGEYQDSMGRCCVGETEGPLSVAPGVGYAVVGAGGYICDTDVDGCDPSDTYTARHIAAFDPAFIAELADLLDQVGGRDVPASNSAWWDKADALRDRLPRIINDPE
jgi:hypothetical protein